MYAVSPSQPGLNLDYLSELNHHQDSHSEFVPLAKNKPWYKSRWKKWHAEEESYGRMGFWVGGMFHRAAVQLMEIMWLLFTQLLGGHILVPKTIASLRTCEHLSADPTWTNLILFGFLYSKSKMKDNTLFTTHIKSFHPEIISATINQYSFDLRNLLGALTHIHSAGQSPTSDL